ncbi:hypothetical protein Tco_1493741 [Tanacetum coccineum]
MIHRNTDLHLTHVLRSSSSARVEPSSYTLNPVRIIPGLAGTVQLSSSTCFEPSSSTLNPVRIIPDPAGLVQQAKQLKEKIIILDPDEAVMSTQEYMQKVVEDDVYTHRYHFLYYITHTYVRKKLRNEKKQQTCKPACLPLSPLLYADSYHTAMVMPTNANASKPISP